MWPGMVDDLGPAGAGFSTTREGRCAPPDYSPLAEVACMHRRGVAQDRGSCKPELNDRPAGKPDGALYFI